VPETFPDDCLDLGEVTRESDRRDVDVASLDLRRGSSHDEGLANERRVDGNLNRSISIRFCGRYVDGRLIAQYELSQINGNKACDPPN